MAVHGEAEFTTNYVSPPSPPQTAKTQGAETGAIRSADLLSTVALQFASEHGTPTTNLPGVYGTRESPMYLLRGDACGPHGDFSPGNLSCERRFDSARSWQNHAPPNV